MRKIVLPLVLEEPNRPSFLSVNAKWISGEGAGSWFDIFELDRKKKLFEISRYSQEGELECRGIYLLNKDSGQFNLSDTFQITYPSNCQKVTYLQSGFRYELIFNQFC